MIVPLYNNNEYKSLCLSAWQVNSDFWDKTRDINSYVKEFILTEIDSSLKKIRIADIGCGNGWLLKELVNKGNDFEYTGIDFNRKFIDNLNDMQPKYEWHCLDFTQPMSFLFENKFDIVVSCLSIIEMADLNVPFQNFNNLLEENGTLILVTLDPYFEIIRLNDNYKDLENDMSIFRNDQLSKYYKKEIIIDGKGTENYYYGVLHSLTNLNKAILNNDFSVNRFEELNFNNGKIAEPIYHAYTLRKNE